MKLLIATGMLILGGCVWGGINNLFVSKTHNSTEVEQIVKDFWNFAEKNDYSRLAQIVSDTPDDFYKNCLSDEIKSRRDNLYDLKFIRESKVTVKQADKGKNIESLNEIQMNDILKSTLDFFMRKKVQLKEVTEIKQTEKEAIVTISYGNTDFTVSSENMLLFKENGNWKVFMIVPSSVLENSEHYKDFTKKPRCETQP